MKPRYTQNNSNPFSKEYFKEHSKKYIDLAKKSFKRLEKENDEMYLDDGTLSDKYDDQTMCDYSDMEKFLEFIECKDDFYTFGSCIVDLIKLDNEIEKGEKLLLKVTEKMNKYKKEKRDILFTELKVEPHIYSYC